MLRMGALLSAPGLLWLGVFLLLPMLGLCVLAFASRGNYGAVEWSFSLGNVKRLFGFGLFGWTPDTLMILLRSAVLAVGTTALCVTLSFPLAFWIAGRPKENRNLLMALVMVPSCTNLVIRTYAWMLALEAQMPPAWLARWTGLIGPEDSLYPGSMAVFLGMVSSMLPFAALPIYTAVERLDWSLVEAARDLYAKAFSTFRHAILPQVLPGTVAAVILTLVPSLGMFVVSDLLGGARNMLIGNLIQQQFGSASDWPYGAMVGMFLVLTSLLSLAVFQRWGGGLVPKNTVEERR
ncbi:MAG TPA: ABC transporter permease [Fibrobacteraceae bacterium]|nr:ABC transporter permease [Fibrobacteraceae bacterium]